jgi:hypothetical protein
VHFRVLPTELAHVSNTSVRGLHYLLIYVSYNEILLLLYLFKFVQHNQHLSCERLHMDRIDDCNILQPRHLAGNRMGGTHDSVSVENLSIPRLRLLK